MAYTRLRANAKKIGDKTILISCWMEGVLNDSELSPECDSLLNRSFSQSTYWYEQVVYDNTHLCSIRLDLQGNTFHFEVFSFGFLGTRGNLTKLTSVEVLREGSHSFHLVENHSFSSWSSKWINTNWKSERLPYVTNCSPREYRSPFSQVILNLSDAIELGNIPSNRVYVKESEKLALERFSSLLQDQSFVDVTFCVKGVNVKAHSVIVAAGSPILSAMFQHDFEENRTRTVIIDDTKAQVFLQLVQYLYTGSASDIEKEDVTVDLLIAADKYGVEPLKEECAALIGRNLKSENIINILILAHLHSIPYLYQSAVDFMTKHSKRVCLLPDFQKFIENYPTLSCQVIQCMFGATKQKP